MNMDIREVARLAAQRTIHEALSTGRDLQDSVADAVAKAVLEEVERYGARRNGAGVVARRLMRQFQDPVPVAQWACLKCSGRSSRVVTHAEGERCPRA